MKMLVVLNDPPYGTERSYNGLHLAVALSSATASTCGCSSSATPSAAR